MNFATIVHYFMTTVSLITALGVFTHDSRIDKAAFTAINAVGTHRVPLAKAAIKFSDFSSADPHTHSHHNAGKALLSGFVYQSPSVAPRRKSHHRELSHLTARPHHAFDNTLLPLLT